MSLAVSFSLNVNPLLVGEYVTNCNLSVGHSLYSIWNIYFRGVSSLQSTIINSSYSCPMANNSVYYKFRVFLFLGSKQLNHNLQMGPIPKAG